MDGGPRDPGCARRVVHPSRLGPRHGALLTADHGVVDVPSSGHVLFDTAPELVEGVAHIGGRAAAASPAISSHRRAGGGAPRPLGWRNAGATSRATAPGWRRRRRPWRRAGSARDVHPEVAAAHRRRAGGRAQADRVLRLARSVAQAAEHDRPARFAHRGRDASAPPAVRSFRCVDAAGGKAASGQIVVRACAEDDLVPARHRRATLLAGARLWPVPPGDTDSSTAGDEAEADRQTTERMLPTTRGRSGECRRRATILGFDFEDVERFVDDAHRVR